MKLCSDNKVSVHETLILKRKLKGILITSPQLALADWYLSDLNAIKIIYEIFLLQGLKSNVYKKCSIGKFEQDITIHNST